MGGKLCREHLPSSLSRAYAVSGSRERDLIYVRYHSHKFILNEYLISAIKLHEATMLLVTFQYHAGEFLWFVC